MSTRTTDPELKAIATVAAALAELDEKTRRRVLLWLSDRYLPTLPTRAVELSRPEFGADEVHP